MLNHFFATRNIIFVARQLAKMEDTRNFIRNLLHNGSRQSLPVLRNLQEKITPFKKKTKYDGYFGQTMVSKYCGRVQQ